MEIKENTFVNILDAKEGIVLLGCGGDLQEWINGVSTALNEEGIAKTAEPTKLWESATKLQTTGGRTDLILTFADNNNLNIGKMAMWRLRFGDCSWVSDYKVNYANQHQV